MDQIKIGKFIAMMRKEQSFTQKQLAEQLGISDKTISKWETGNGMPEVSLMLPLCDVLKINVNELLSGERLTEHNYHERAEENMVKLIQEKDDKQKEDKKRVIAVALISVLLLIVGFSVILNFQVTMAHIILLFGVVGELLGFVWLREKRKADAENVAAPVLLTSTCGMIILVGLVMVFI